MPTPGDSKEFKDADEWRDKSRNQELNVCDCVASWTDVCGFGNLLEQNEWDLHRLQKAGVMHLLSEVYTVAGRPLFTTPFGTDKVIVLNDGVARTLDLIQKEKWNTYLFLFFIRDLMTNHYLLLNITKTYGVGVRTILSGGERVQYSPTEVTGHSVLSYDSEKLSERGKKLLGTTFVYNPAEFQMNTGFAKAYTIDALGSKQKIEINGFYIEDTFFEKIKGFQDLEILKNTNEIKILYKGNLVFILEITESLSLNMKGIKVLVHRVNRLIITKDFDDDEAVYELYQVPFSKK